MVDYRIIEQRLSEALTLQRRPVAVTFRETPPGGVPKFTGTQPSGCSFWRIAARGEIFYTIPSDHYNCAIGSYTHNLALPQDRTQELDQTLSFMAGIGYIKMEEVPLIPRLPQPPGVVIYAPLGDTPVEPDVVLFAGRPGRVMLLQEAALRAGVGAHVPLFSAARRAWCFPPLSTPAPSPAWGVSGIASTPMWETTNCTLQFLGRT